MVSNHVTYSVLVCMAKFDIKYHWDSEQNHTSLATHSDHLQRLAITLGPKALAGGEALGRVKALGRAKA